MTPTPYFYHGRPYAVVSVHATARGIEIAVYLDGPEDSTVSTCVLNCADFEQLISDGDAVLTAARATGAPKTPELPLLTWRPF